MLSKGVFWQAFAAVLVFSILVAGCGGSKSGSTSAAATSTPTAKVSLVTGVAATGAPIIAGVLSVTDKSGATVATGTVNADGTYSVDLAGKTGPFLFTVYGVSKGVVQVLHSVATDADVGKTVNSTQLTTLLVRYAAGQAPENCAAAATASNCLTTAVTNMGTAQTEITKVVSPALTAAGVTAPVDFRTTTFKADHTGIDRMLDLVVVTPPATAGAPATVALATGATTPITLGSLPTTTATPATVTAPPAADITKAQKLADAGVELEAFGRSFFGLFATALPTAAQVQAMLDPAFLNNGQNSLAFSNAMAGGLGIQVGQAFAGGGIAETAGVLLPGKTIASVNYDANGCPIEIWMLLGNGNMIPMLFKDTIPVTNAVGVCTGGTWKMAGNQRNYFDDIHVQYTQVLDAANNLLTTNSDLNIGSVNTMQSTGNPLAAIPWATIDVSAVAGTPAAGGLAGGVLPGTVTLLAPPAGGVLQSYATISDPNNYYGTAAVGTPLLSKCAVVPVIPAQPACYNAGTLAGTKYQVVYKNALGAVLETHIVSLRNDPNVAPTLAFFPTNVSITPSNLAGMNAVASPVSVTANWKLPPVGIVNWLGVTLNDALGAYVAQGGAQLTSGQTTATFNLTKAAGTATSGFWGVFVNINGNQYTFSKQLN